MLKKRTLLGRVASMAMLLCITTTAEAQHNVSWAANSPVAGDSVSCQRLPYAYEGQGGEDAVWDFSGLDAEGDSYTKYHQPSDSLLLGMEARATHFYQTDGEWLWQTGYETPLERMDYTEPQLQMHFPLLLGETYAQGFGGEGRYCGTHFVREGGSVQLKADGEGTLILADGDTLHHTLRVQTLTIQAVRLSHDSLENDIDNMKQVITERYSWYAQGYRYPVFETVSSTSYDNGQPVATRQWAIRCQPDVQLALNDSINEDVRREMAMEAAADIFAYEVTQDASNRVTVSYNLSADATLRVVVADVMGVLHMAQEQTHAAGQGYEMSLDCSGLRRGQYIIYMNVNGTVYNHKITVK